MLNKQCACIMAIILILFAGITQTNKEFHNTTEYTIGRFILINKKLI
jgi:hypothetical protein